jgi:hypothetical protein
MSYKTHYFCDQCKKEVEQNYLTEIKLELNPYSSYTTKKFDSSSKYYSICEQCTEKLGFTIRKVEEAQTKVEPTTAEKLYDLIAQMIYESQP